MYLSTYISEFIYFPKMWMNTFSLPPVCCRGGECILERCSSCSHPLCQSCRSLLHFHFLNTSPAFTPFASHIHMYFLYVYMYFPVQSKFTFKLSKPLILIPFLQKPLILIPFLQIFYSIKKIFSYSLLLLNRATDSHSKEECDALSKLGYHQDFYNLVLPIRS